MLGAYRVAIASRVLLEQPRRELAPARIETASQSSPARADSYLVDSRRDCRAAFECSVIPCDTGRQPCARFSSGWNAAVSDARSIGGSLRLPRRVRTQRQPARDSDRGARRDLPRSVRVQRDPARYRPKLDFNRSNRSNCDCTSDLGDRVLSLDYCRSWLRVAAFGSHTSKARLVSASRMWHAASAEWARRGSLRLHTSKANWRRLTYGTRLGPRLRAAQRGSLFYCGPRNAPRR